MTKLEAVLPYLGHLALDQIGKGEMATWMERLSQQEKSNGESCSRETLKSADGGSAARC